MFDAITTTQVSIPINQSRASEGERERESERLLFEGVEGGYGASHCRIGGREKYSFRLYMILVPQRLS